MYVCNKYINFVRCIISWNAKLLKRYEVNGAVVGLVGGKGEGSWLIFSKEIKYEFKIYEINDTYLYIYMLRFDLRFH